MKTRDIFYFVPQLTLIIITSILLVMQSAYFPLKALKSTQIVRMINNNDISGTPLTEIDLLKQSILMSPGNCEAYPLIADRFTQYAFPKYDNSLGYTTLLRQKGKYNEATANEILVILNSGLRQCDRYLERLLPRRGYLYYLMGKPNLALTDFESLKKLGTDNSSLFVYEVMANVYADLQDPIKAGVTLIFSMSQGRKDIVDEDIKKIERINQYLDSALVSIIPNRNAGFGRYSTATMVDNQLSYFGIISGDTSILVYLQPNDDSSVSRAKVLDAGNNVQLSTALDKEGITHIAYLFGDRYIIYANSKDNFIKKTVIDAHNISSITDKPFSVDLNSVQLAIDNKNTPQLIWSYKSGYIGYISLENNKTGSSSDIISNDGVFPDLVVLRNGALGVVYNNLAAFPAQSTQIIYKEKNGEDWGNPINISKSSQWSGAANIIADETGALHVFYITGSSSENAELMHVTRDLKGNWQQPEVIANNNFRPLTPYTTSGSQLKFVGRTAPSVILLSGNRIAVVWRGPFANDSTQIFGRVYSDGEWKSIETIGKISGQNFYDTQSIVLRNGNFGNIILAWSDNGNLIFHEWNP